MKNRNIINQAALVLISLIAFACTRGGTYREVAHLSRHTVEPITEARAKEYGLDTDFYKKHTRVQGIEIVTSNGVSDHAHLEAAFLTEVMMQNLPPDFAQRLRDAGALCIIYGHAEFASDIPEFKTDKTGLELDYYNWRTRGANSRRHDRLVITVGEEDLMEYEGGMQLESIYIHEFAHAVHGTGADPAFKERINKAFDDAKAKGLWQDARAAQRFRRVRGDTPVSLHDALVKAFPEHSREFFRKCFADGRIEVNGEKAKSDVRVTEADKVIFRFGGPKTAYAGKNRAEYWAEGVQSWFDTNRIDDHDHNQIDTREELKAYDPGLAKLCEEVFGETAWRFVSPRERAGLGHLKGYDPAKAPNCEDTEIIKTAANDYYDKYWKDHREALRKKYGD